MNEDNEEWCGPRGRAVRDASREVYKRLLNKFKQGVHATFHTDDIPKWRNLKKKLSDMGLSMSYNGKKREYGMLLVVDIGLTVIDELEPVADAYNCSMKEYLEKQFKPFLVEIKRESLKQPLLNIHKESQDEIHDVVIQNVSDNLQTMMVKREKEKTVVSK